MERGQLFLIEEINQCMEKEWGENHCYDAMAVIDTGSVHQWMLKLVSKGKQGVTCIVSKYISPQINIY